MISNDLLLSLSGFCFLICALPQLFRNWRYRDTITQSLMTNGFILIGNTLSLIAYMQLGILLASVFIVVELFITITLIIQIIIWRNNKKKRKVIQTTEGARAFVRSLKGLR